MAKIYIDFANKVLESILIELVHDDKLSKLYTE